MEEPGVPEREDQPALDFMAGNKRVRAYGDLEAGLDQNWSRDFGDERIDPADRLGDRIADTDKNEETHAEKMRRKFHRDGTSAVEKAGKAAKHVKDAVSHPPTGLPEVRVPKANRAHHEGIGVGDMVTGLAAGAVVISEAGRWIHGKLKQRQKG
jgi:hypothetical protein